jgi:hypothetical protein
MRMPLFWLCLVLLFTLGGWRSLTLFTDTTVLSDEHFGQLWSAYSHCQSSIATDEMRGDVQHLSQALHRMNVTTSRHSFLPQSVQRLIEEPPSYLSADPGAMTVACALRPGVAA